MKEEKRFLKGIVVASVLICNILTSCFGTFNISLASEIEEKEIKVLESKKFDQTEVIKSTSLIDNLLTPVSGITSIDLTGLATGTDANHTHIYERKYDNTKHWEECWICGAKRNESTHKIVTTGTGTCHSGNNKLVTYCSDGCGYSVTTTVPHTAEENWNTSITQRKHYKSCTVCKNWAISEICKDANGNVLGCSTGKTGTCATCGYVWTNANHGIMDTVVTEHDDTTEKGELKCQLCQKVAMTYTTTKEVLGESKVKYTTKVIPLSGTILQNNPRSIGGTCHSLFTPLTITNNTYKLNSDGTADITATVEYPKDMTNLIEVHTWVDVMIDGQNTEAHIALSRYGSADNYAPTSNSITVSGNGTINNYSQKATITAKVKETYSDYVEMRLLDSDKKTVLVNWGAATENSDIFTRTMDVIAEMQGTKTLYVESRDRMGNKCTQSISVQYIDAKAPILASQTGNTTTWAKSKEITYTVNDGGIGGASIAFNNQSDFQVASQSGNNYSRTYNFYGDVYGSVTGALYIKDALGNIRTEKVTISKLDGTLPTITGTSIKNNTITVTANDQKAGMGEGSGVTGYRYIASNTKLTNPSISTNNSTQVTGKTTGTGTFTVDNIADANYIYVAAVDAVGNIGTAVEVPVPKLTLGNTIDLSAEDGKGGVKLTWTIDNSADKVYSIYQQGENEATWTAINEKIEGTTLTTSTSKDVAIPNKPIVTVQGIENNKIKINQSATDNGSTYSFYAEAYDKTNTNILLSRSNQVTGTITTGVKGYYYVTDNNETNDFDIADAKYVDGENIELDIEHNGEYIHIKAVDNAGNVSQESVALIWIESQATVDPNKGNLGGDENSRVLVGLVGKTVDLGTPTRTGYRFLGWSATAGTINGTIYTYALEAGVVTANWQINDYEYRVEYYYNGIKDKTATETGIATYMTQISEYKSKGKAGYIFDTVLNYPLTITEKEETNVIKVYYKTNTSITKTVSYTILFYKDGVIDLNASRTIRKAVQVLLPDQVAVDKNLIDPNKYEGYELEKTLPSPLPEYVNNGGVVNVYYVSKAAKAVVKYVDKFTGEEIAEQKEIEGKVHSEYNISGSQKEIEGYTLVEGPENLTGTFTKEIEEFTYYYAKNSNVIVKYLEKDTNEVLANEESIIKYQGESYETSPKEIENYELVEIPENATGTIERDNIEVVYYYLQKTKVTVNHVDVISGEILETETIDGKVGDKYETYSKDISDYVLATENEEGDSILPENATGEMTKEEIVVNYYYKHISEGVVEKHIDKITGEILDNVMHEGNEGDFYETSSKEFEGYELDQTALPENASGKMKKELVEVKYYYIRKAIVRVQYLDRNTNEVIAEETVIEGHEKDQYTTEAKEIEDYYIVESMLPINSTGEMTKEETTVIYYYAKKSAGVIEKHIDEKTGTVIEEKLHEGLIGDEYTTSPKDIEGYEIDKTKLPENATGKMIAEQIEVDYYYIRKAQVKVKYIDELTNEVIEQNIIAGHEGDSYIAEAKEIKGYVLDEEKLPENSTGIMTVIVNEDGTVTSEIVVEYYYKKISAGVIERHIDIKTDKVIQDELYEGTEGDEYKTSPKEYEEYDLVTTKLPENAEGEMTVELIEVKYYYIRKATVRVEYVDNETKEKISEDTIIEGHEDDEYTTEAKEIKDYVLNKEKLPENSKGKMTVTRSEKTNEEEVTETVVRYYYDKNKKSDEDGKNQNNTGKPSDNENNNNSNNGNNNSNNNNGNSNSNGSNNSSKNGNSTTIKILSDTTTSNSSNTSQNDKTVMPSTGDIMPVIAISIIALVALANIVQIIINKRRKNT